MKKFIGLLIIMFVISILGGILFPPKTKIDIKKTSKDNICEEIEKYTNRKAIDL